MYDIVTTVDTSTTAEDAFDLASFTWDSVFDWALHASANCESAYLPACLPECLIFCLPVFLPVRLCLSVNPSVHLSDLLCLSLCMCLFLSLSLCLAVPLSLYIATTKESTSLPVEQAKRGRSGREGGKGGRAVGGPSMQGQCGSSTPHQQTSPRGPTQSGRHHKNRKLIPRGPSILGLPLAPHHLCGPHLVVHGCRWSPQSQHSHEPPG